jgi:rhodanese-related sulfurtransferase
MRPHLPSELKHSKKEDLIVLYCRTGNRAMAVQNALHRHGYTHVENSINQTQTDHRIKRK